MLTQIRRRIRRTTTGHDRTRRRDADVGPTAREYAMLAAAIATVVILVVAAVGFLVEDQFDETCQELIAQFDVADEDLPENCRRDQ